MKIPKTVLMKDNILSVTWTALLICGSLRFADAKTEDDVDNLNSIVHRLKLKLLPVRSDVQDDLPHVPNTTTRVARSNSLTWTLTKLLAPNRSPIQNATMKWSDLSSTNITRTSELSQPHPLKRVYKRAPVMERFRTAYSNFHRSLQVFVQLLIERFKPETPSTLRNIKLIPEVMTPDDQDIEGMNVGGIIQKLFVVQEIVLTVIDKVQPFVQEECYEWLRKQSKFMKWRLNSLGFVALNLRVGDTGPQIAILPSGISGVNNGFHLGANYGTLVKLTDLMKHLLYSKP